MTQALLFDSLEAFEIRENEIHQGILATVPGYQAPRYAYAHKHPNRALWALILDERSLPLVHPGETVYFLTDEWFRRPATGIEVIRPTLWARIKAWFAMRFRWGRK